MDLRLMKANTGEAMRGQISTAAWRKTRLAAAAEKMNGKADSRPHGIGQSVFVLNHGLEYANGVCDYSCNFY